MFFVKTAKSQKTESQGEDSQMSEESPGPGEGSQMPGDSEVPDEWVDSKGFTKKFKAMDLEDCDCQVIGNVNKKQRILERMEALEAQSSGSSHGEIGPKLGPCIAPYIGLQRAL
jgi:hypothetical protein